MKKSIVLGLLAAVAISACGSTPTDMRQLELKYLDPSEKAVATNVPVDCKEMLSSKDASCSPPPRARHKIDRNFKYGRFCGANYPGLLPASGKDENSLTDQERLDVAKNYYRIRPVDDIDAVCREHDVCWLLNPANKLSCNDKYVKSMDRIRSDLEGQIGWFDVDTPQFRCSQLALDISFASTFMQSNSTDKASEIGVSLAKLFTAPVTVLYAMVFVLSNGFENYPRDIERCSVSELGKIRQKNE